MSVKDSILIISCSLNPESRSRLLAKHASSLFDPETNQVEIVDLRDYELPLCDGAETFKHANVLRLQEKIKAASAILIAVPIYNYAVSAAAKNMVELTGSAWNDKIVGFLCAAGGKSSLMAALSLANSMMLDFRCLIVPRFVYADKSAFTANQVTDDGIKQRIADQIALASTLVSKLKTA